MWGQWYMLMGAGAWWGQKRKSDPSGTGVTGSPEAKGLPRVQDQPGLPNKTLFQIWTPRLGRAVHGYQGFSTSMRTCWIPRTHIKVGCIAQESVYSAGAPVGRWEVKTKESSETHRPASSVCLARTHTQTHAHRHTHRGMNTQTHTYIHAWIHRHPPAYIQEWTHTYMHVPTFMHGSTHAHTCMHAYTCHLITHKYKNINNNKTLLFCLGCRGSTVEMVS